MVVTVKVEIVIFIRIIKLILVRLCIENEFKNLIYEIIQYYIGIIFTINN